MSTWDGAKEKAGKTAEDVKQNNSADANTDLGVTWDSVRNRYADSSSALVISQQHLQHRWVMNMRLAKPTPIRWQIMPNKQFA